MTFSLPSTSCLRKLPNIIVGHQLAFSVYSSTMDEFNDCRLFKQLGVKHERITDRQYVQLVGWFTWEATFLPRLGLVQAARIMTMSPSGAKL